MDLWFRGLLLSVAVFMCFDTVQSRYSMLGLSLTTTGEQIQNAAHTIVTLRSVNRGDPSLCYFVDTSIEGPLDNSTIGGMLSWGINTVRILLNEFCWLNLGGVTYGGSPYQNDIREFVNIMRENELAVIITLAIANAGSSYPAPIQAQSMPNTAHSTQFWTEVATDYSNYTNVIFDLYDLPAPENGVYNTTTAWECWLYGGSNCTASSDNYGVVGMQHLVSTIRAIAPHNIIMVSGIEHGNSLTQFRRFVPYDSAHPTQQRIIAGFHVDTQTSTLCNNPTCWSNDVAPTATHFVVIWVTFDYSVSASSCTCDITCQGAQFSLPFGDLGMSAGYWDADLNCVEGGLISDWCGTPIPVYGTGYQTICLDEVAAGE